MSPQHASYPEYVFPTSTEEAIEFLLREDGDARIIAGGTDIMPQIRQGKIRPGCLVDITRISGLDQIRITPEYVEVGAAVTFADLKDSPFIKEHIHALANAAASVGAVGIQNSATWVGNIVQAMPAADGAIIALALNAEAHVVDKENSEWHPVESLFIGPGLSVVDPSHQLITHLRLPRVVGHWGSAWQRIARRPSLVLPILNCAATIQLDDSGQTIDHATIALGPVSIRPYRAYKAEEYLRGQPLSNNIFAITAQLIQMDVQPRDSIMRASREYRLSVIPAMVETALIAAARQAIKSFLSQKNASVPSNMNLLFGNVLDGTL